MVQWPYNAPLWYVYAIFLLAVLSFILIFLFRNKRIGFVILVCIIAFLNYRNNLKSDMIAFFINFGFIPNILLYLPAYLVGAFYGKHYTELRNANSLVYALILLFVSYFQSWTDLGTVTVLLFPIFAVYLLSLPDKITNLNVYKLTFLMYALHSPIIIDFKPLIDSALSIVNCVSFVNLLSRIIILAIDMFLASIIYALLKKMCPILLKIITGGRI